MQKNHLRTISKVRQPQMAGEPVLCMKSGNLIKDAKCQLGLKGNIT